MAIKLLVPHEGFPTGALLSTDFQAERDLIAVGKASADLNGGFVWPSSRDSAVLGPFSTKTALQAAYPASSYAGFSALVGSSIPYATYISDGASWLSVAAIVTDPVTGAVKSLTSVGASIFADDITFRGEAAGVVMIDWGDAAVTLGSPTAGWTVAKDAAKTFAGKSSLRVVATAGAADTMTCAITVPSTYLGAAKVIGFPVASGDSYISGGDTYPAQLWISLSGGTTHRITSYMWPASTPGEWNEGFVYDQDAVGSGHIVGTAQWAKLAAEEFTTITLVMTKRAGQEIVDPVWIGPVVTDPVKPQPATLTLFFDGQYSGQYKYARQLLQAYGMRASLAILVPWIETYGGTMSAAEIQRMYDLGHECVYHTGAGAAQGWDNTSKYPNGEEYALVKADIEAFRTWARTNGYLRGIDYGVVGNTNGMVNTQTVARRKNIAQAVRDAGMRKMRHLNAYNSSYYGCNNEGDVFATPSTMVVAATATATVTGVIDQLVARRGWSHLTFHDIALSGASGNNYNIADLETVLDYAATKQADGTLRIKLFSEAMDELSRLPGPL